MANHLYVDVPGLRREARRCPFAPTGTDWQVDLGLLCQLVAAFNSPLHRVVVCGGGPTAEDSLPDVLRATGFQVRIANRVAGQTGTHALERELLSDSRELVVPGRDEVTVVSGDERLAATVERLRTDGVAIHLYFFVRAPRRLRQAATTFRGLDGWLYRLVRPASSV
jgi:hypothetical protein